MNIKRSKLGLLAVILAAGLFSSVYAQEDTHTVMYDSIRFTYPSFLFTSLQIEAVEAVPYSENLLFAETYPAHIRFSFLNYGDESRLPYPFAAPQLLVYSAEAIREFGYEFSAQYDALSALLSERPDLDAYIGASVRLPAIRLPFLPWINSAQVLRSHPLYMDIAGGGSGIRYVTHYSQESAHITDLQLFYTFQGMVGAYYVSAILPVKTGVLPEAVDTSDVNWDEFAANYDVYLAETFALIENVPDDAFTPSLNTLDTLVQSITVDPGWQTYTSVSAGYRLQYPPDRQVCASEGILDFIPGAHAYHDPEVDQCLLSYQANPISVIFGQDDDAFQAFRAENFPSSFADYQEEAIRIHDLQADRISGREIETDTLFMLVRIQIDNSYLILRAFGEENIEILNRMIPTLRILPKPITQTD